MRATASLVEVMYIYTRGGGGFVSRDDEKAQKVVLLVSLVPQLEFQCICYEGNGKSCGE